MPRTVRLFHPSGPDRVAVISAEAAYAQPGHWLIRLARGKRAGLLTGGTTYGPVAERELDERFEEVVAGLLAEGFVESGRHELLAALESPEAKVRARAALRLGWSRCHEAVEPLIARMDAAVDDLCSIVDALGWIGDGRAIKPIREQAQRKLLSRRRSAVEALRNLDDSEGLAKVREASLERLPKPLVAALKAGHGDPAPVIEAIKQVEPKRLGLVLDSVYELDMPGCSAAVGGILAETGFGRPFLWRYVKSILKRSMLRHDACMFGRVAHRVEAQARVTAGTKASVKSGYDGQKRTTLIFGRKTQTYVRRLTWRYLRQLARYRPEKYTAAAAEVLIHYDFSDAQEPRGLAGQYASCYLFNRILYGAGGRLKLDNRRLVSRFRSSRHVTPTKNAREESYRKLWDAHPRPYLRLLSAARLPEIHDFALRAIRRSHPDLLSAAGADELLGMIVASHDPTVQLGIEELGRRFDPSRPDWHLLDRLVADERPAVRELAERWLRDTAATWLEDASRIAAYLHARNGSTQSLVASIVCEGSIGPAVRRELALLILDALRDPAAENVEAMARVARTVLIEEVNDLLSLSEALAMIGGTAAAQSVAAEAIARRPEAIVELGLPRLAAFANHEVMAVRAAAHQLLRFARAELESDPSILFTLAESRWEDTRKLAIEQLRTLVDWTTASLDHVMGIVDSNRADVQNFGIELARQGLDRLDAAELVLRLAQHPHPNMRRFALELIEQHLPDGIDALGQMSRFFRAGLFDTWPQRKVKHGIIEFLTDRAIEDPQQAEFATRLLDEFVRVQGRGDFGQALAALARIQLAHPGVTSRVAVRMEALQ